MNGLLSFAGSPHGGVQRLLPEWNSQPVIRPVGVIDHSQVGSTDGTFLLFRDRSGLESHFSVRGRRSGTRNGFIEQFMSIDRQADANLHANAFTNPVGVRCGYLSVETEDDGDPDTQPWTREQLASLKWLHERLIRVRPTIRRAEALTCFGGGLGFHTKLGAPSCWTPVAKTCPGGVRKIQWEAELLPAFLHPTGEEDDLTDEQARQLQALYDAMIVPGTRTGEDTMDVLFARIRNVEGTVGRLAAAQGIDFTPVDSSQIMADND